MSAVAANSFRDAFRHPLSLSELSILIVTYPVTLSRHNEP